MQDLITGDLNHIWHPGARMKDFEICPPLIVSKAKGPYLYTNRGKLIDGISSWWTKSLGHQHPKLIKAIKNQLAQFEHVIAWNTTHPKMVALGKKLAQLSQKKHVFFASDGASAVEISLKLALHANRLKGLHSRNQFVALKNAYHGETLATLAVSDLGLYKKPYEGFGPSCHFIENVPYVHGESDPLWADASSVFKETEQQLNAIKDSICAVIVEPLLQGAAGMRLYSLDFLQRLASWAQKNDIYLIADEIMTGMGRLGHWFAANLAHINPDMICLSKGLTSGSLPISLVLIDESIYQLFNQNDDDESIFFHSHTYSGNALGVAAALATIEIMEEEKINEKARELGSFMKEQFQEIALSTGLIDNIRSIGAMVAGDLKPLGKERISFHIYQKALEYGALLKPIGSTLYWLPPLNTSKDIIVKLAKITLNSIKATYN